MERIYEQATRYNVSCLPLEHKAARYFTLYVEWRGNGKWAVSDGHRCLDRSGEWDYEALPSNREDEWLAQHRFELDEALALAREAAKHITINGVNVEQALTEWR